MLPFRHASRGTARTRGLPGAHGMDCERPGPTPTLGLRRARAPAARSHLQAPSPHLRAPANPVGPDPGFNSWLLVPCRPRRAGHHSGEGLLKDARAPVRANIGVPAAGTTPTSPAVRSARGAGGSPASPKPASAAPIRWGGATLRRFLVDTRSTSNDRSAGGSKAGGDAASASAPSNQKVPLHRQRCPSLDLMPPRPCATLTLRGCGP